MKTEITPERQEHIVNYLMTNLSKKGVKMSHFAEMCGIDQVSLSKTKKEGTRHLVSTNAWNHLNRIYETKSFDDVMSGAIVKFQPKQGKKDVITGGSDPVISLIEPKFHERLREENARFEAMEKERKPVIIDPNQDIHEQKVSKAVVETESLEEKNHREELESMKIKRLSENPELVNRGQAVKQAEITLVEAGKEFVSRTRNDYAKQIPAEFNVLQESVITVGMAIDALIKAGAKVSVSLEV